MARTHDAYITEFVEYNDSKHRVKFLELNIEYMTWIRKEVSERYGRDLFKDRPSVRQYVESVMPKFIESKPPEGVVYILEVDGVPVGMGALRRLEEGVAEIKRMYIQPSQRGRGLGGLMMEKLVDAAGRFGYNTIRLDTAEFMTAARHIYESAGFKVREPYTGAESSSGQSFQIFMEKKIS